MEFDKTSVSCLKQKLFGTQCCEQTQEVKINDAMPDVDRVLGAWGQVLLRSKEWRPGELSVSGGIMAWVLYLPEEGEVVQCVECWLPFQSKFDFRDDGLEGTIQVSCSLDSIDARSTSARKLMVRGSVAITCEARVPVQIERYAPGDVPENVYLLRETYRFRSAAEAGEKQFSLDEELSVSTLSPPISRILRYELHPELTEERIVANKLVFRGIAHCHILYAADTGELYSQDFEIPFSQYGELNGDYDEDGEAAIVFAVTNLELDADGERIRIKVSLTGQYTVYQQLTVPLTVDAYSLQKNVNPIVSELNMPVVLDNYQQPVCMEAVLEMPGIRIADVTFMQKGLQIRRNPDVANWNLQGGFQILFYNGDGKLECKFIKSEAASEAKADQKCAVSAFTCFKGIPEYSVSSGKTELQCKGVIDLHFMSENGMNMISGLEYSEREMTDREKPSLILKRAGTQSLWQLAKSCGSTVEVIQKINHLSEKPEPSCMLLIPILHQ